MAWAALGKSLLKSGVKKVATKKLLNRKKKPKVGKVKAEKLMGGGDNKEKGGAIVKSGSSNIVPVSSPITSITKAETQTKSGSLMVIKEKVLEIDKLLKGTLAAEKVQQKNQRKQQEKDERKQDEQEIEGAPKTEKTRFNLPLPKKVTSFWGEIKRYFGTVLFGWLAVRLIDWLPKLMPLLKGLARFADFVIYLGGVALNVLVSAVDIGYKAYDWTRGVIKNTFGEDAAQTFDSVMGTLKKVIMAVAAIGVGFSIMAGVFAGGAGGAAATAAGGAAGGAGATAGGIVAGVGLLASGLGEGAFQIKKKGQEAEDAWFKRYKEKWWTDPRKAVDWGILQIIKGFNFVTGIIGTTLDIIGAPFRYLIELVRYPFLDDAGKAKQRENLAKFDARIREQFREIVNAFSLGLLAKDKGAFGSIYGKEGTDAMGYTKDGKTKSRQAAIKEGSILLTTPDLIATQDLLKGKPSGEKVHKIEKITEKGEKDKKPKGLGRVVSGLADWATMGLTEFDKRGDSLGQRIGKGSIDFMLGDLTDLDRKGNLFGGINKLGDVRSKKKITPLTKTTTSSFSDSIKYSVKGGKVDPDSLEEGVPLERAQQDYLESQIRMLEYQKRKTEKRGSDTSAIEKQLNALKSRYNATLEFGGYDIKGNGNNILPLDVNSVKAKNVSDFASYEEGSDEEIVVVAPSPSKSNQYQDKEESFVPLVIGGGGGGEDPYSNLYEGG